MSLFATAASQVGPQWHAWLHYMNDEVPGQLKGYDGKTPTYTLAHNYNQTGRAGTPQQQPDRYYPAWHVNSRHYKGQFEVRVSLSVPTRQLHMPRVSNCLWCIVPAQEVVEAWVPPGTK